ncbi:hypothetical protein Fcan01_23027 [Folsomia candida]|uniref:Sulfatase N-terminal domain-containing protein n=1 Tax=Folsomia candida TaxID=158441 RepID=A0A226D9G0_FOLCA|nr:hypothetical protein Fcan01_23027 [Folsomia candida]
MRLELEFFSLNWKKPFVKPPTDFYIRPFSSYMETNLGKGDDNMCYGTRRSFKMLLDNIENIAVAQKNRPYFHFTWATKLSHNNFNKLHQGDGPLLEFLQFMATNGYLNHTALLILGDHGNRSPTQAQMNPAGKVEVRMPVFYLVLPDWFKAKYSQPFKNLQYNADSLTSPYDVYETLKLFMNLSQLRDTQSYKNADTIINVRKPMSLFQKIPFDRSCLEAGVSLHWCVCRGARDERPAPTTTPEVRNDVTASVDFMNVKLKPVSTKCHPLALKETVSAYHIDNSVISTL